MNHQEEHLQKFNDFQRAIYLHPVVHPHGKCMEIAEQEALTSLPILS